MVIRAKRIVVLDGYTLNPGDLDWAPLAALGPCAIHDRSDAREARERAAGADVVLVNKTPMDAGLIGALPELRYIGVLATGYNVVDTAAAKARGIPVANIPTYGTQSVAQTAFALLLELTNQVGRHAASVAAGDWARSKDFCYWQTPLTELAGLTMGLVGYGRIGRATAAIARAFGMHVAAHDRFLSGRHADDGTPLLALEELLAASDAVSLHCPLTADNKHLIDKDRLALMKPTAFLVNTSRGALVEPVALAEALREGRLAGAGLDVLETEPPPADHPLLGAPRCFITPHIAWATASARKRLLDIAVANVAAFLSGRPENIVNP